MNVVREESNLLKSLDRVIEHLENKLKASSRKASLILSQPEPQPSGAR